MSDRDYTTVPVPTHLVMEVMRLITVDNARREVPNSSNPRTASGETDETRKWNRVELQVIWDNRDKSSVNKFSRVLSLLADAYPDPMAKKDIGDALGIEFLRLQNALGRFTAFIENRLPDARWPLVMDADTWTVDEETAATWRSITSGESDA
jgi:hypothetical protein